MHASLSSLAIALVAVLSLGGTVCAEVPPEPASADGVCHLAEADAYPFATAESLAKPLCQSFPAPAGYQRVEVKEGSFGDWLRHLPLMPEGTSPLRWDGSSTGWSSSQAPAVVALGPIAKVEDCAGAAVRLWAEYMVNQGTPAKLKVTMNQKQTLTWPKYLKGCKPVYDAKKKKLSISCTGGGVSTATKAKKASAIKGFVKKVMTWANSATLARHLKKIDKAKAGIGTVILQPNPSGGIGHASLIADEAVAADGTRLFLVVNGFLPAQDVFLVGPSQSPESRRPWCTIEEFEAFMVALGDDYTYATFQ